MNEEQRHIDTLFAFIVVREDGTESVPAMLWPLQAAGPMTALLPLIGTDDTRIDELRQYVHADPSLKGKTITIARFSKRTDLEVIQR